MIKVEYDETNVIIKNHSNSSICSLVSLLIYHSLNLSNYIEPIQMFDKDDVMTLKFNNKNMHFKNEIIYALKEIKEQKGGLEIYEVKRMEV